MMTSRRSWPSRAIALITAVISLILLPQTIGLSPTSSVVLVTTVAVGGVLAAAHMWVANSFESHVFTSFIAGIVLLGTILSVTLGLPGASRLALGAAQLTLMPLSTAALTLQAVALRQQRRDAAHARSRMLRDHGHPRTGRRG